MARTGRRVVTMRLSVARGIRGLPQSWGATEGALGVGPWAVRQHQPHTLGTFPGTTRKSVQSSRMPALNRRRPASSRPDRSTRLMPAVADPHRPAWPSARRRPQ
jgi:hypothetical protein